MKRNFDRSALSINGPLRNRVVFVSNAVMFSKCKEYVMNLEFLSRTNAVVLELERQGLTATAAAMRQVIADYEHSVEAVTDCCPTEVAN